MTSFPTHRPFPMALVALAALLLGFGMTQFLVRCKGDTGEARLEFVHTPGTCCAHDGDLAADDGREDDARRGEPRASRRSGCEHEDLAVALAPVPKAASFAAFAEVPVFARLPLPPDLPAVAADGRRPHAPATGPPRHDPGLQQLATTHLLI